MRKLIAPVLALALFTMLPAVSYAAETTVVKEFKPADVKSLNFTSISGGIDMDVETGPVHLEILRYNDSFCTLETSLERGELAVRVEQAPGAQSSCRAEIHIKTPNPTGGVTFKTLSGIVDISGLASKADITTTSGDVTVRAGSDITAKTVSGDITVSGTTGITDADTISGAVKIYSGSDALVKTTAGSVRVSYITGRADITTTSGDISGILAGTARITTVSGQTDLDWSKVPALGDITITSVSGHVGIDFPVGTKLAFYRDTVSGQITGQQTMLDMNSQLKVTVTTTTGDIDVGYN